MDARAKLTCPTCGDVLVPVEQVAVAMSEDFLWVAACPYCGHPVYGRLIDGSKIAELVQYGAKVNYAGVADEAEEWLGSGRY